LQIRFVLALKYVFSLASILVYWYHEGQTTTIRNHQIEEAPEPGRGRCLRRQVQDEVRPGQEGRRGSQGLQGVQTRERRGSMSTGWITDRLPTAEDAVAYCVLVWDDNGIGIWSCDAVKEGQPWMPIPKPEPYVKPKRWTVARSEESVCFYLLKQGTYWQSLPSPFSREAAERIADIYNEEMP
jgi:hypothetical protein